MVGVAAHEVDCRIAQIALANRAFRLLKGDSLSFELFVLLLILRRVCLIFLDRFLVFIDFLSTLAHFFNEVALEVLSLNRFVPLQDFEYQHRAQVLNLLDALENFRNFRKALLEPVLSVAAEVVEGDDPKVRLVISVGKTEVVDLLYVVLFNIVVQQLGLEVHHLADLSDSGGEFVQLE